MAGHFFGEIESNGNAWTPSSNPSSDGSDYSISGAEILENGDLKIYEVKKSVKGTRMLRLLRLLPQNPILMVTSETTNLIVRFPTLNLIVS